MITIDENLKRKCEFCDKMGSPQDTINLMEVNMKDHNLVLAKNLKNEAERIMKIKDIWQPFKNHGKIHLSGSAELDLLVYPDLDVYFDFYNSSPVLAEIFAEVASNIVKLPEVVSIKNPRSTPPIIFDLGGGVARKKF